MSLKRLFASLVAKLASGGSARALEIGDAAPDVAAPDQDGAPLSIREYCATGYALVFFFPKAQTSGCTAQACSLRDAYEQLSEKGVKVVGVSVDDVKAQKAFQQKRSLPYPLLADTGHQVAKGFGVPLLMGFAMRQAYLFKDGKLAWKDESASTDKQAEDVLAFLES